MGASQRRKGAVAERELAVIIEDIFGTPASRSARNGVYAAEDIAHEVAGLHIECKRVERLNVPQAMDRAALDSKGKVATLWHRRNRSPWLVTVHAAELVMLAELIIAHREKNNATSHT